MATIFPVTSVESSKDGANNVSSSKEGYTVDLEASYGALEGSRGPLELGYGALAHFYIGSKDSPRNADEPENREKITVFKTKHEPSIAEIQAAEREATTSMVQWGHRLCKPGPGITALVLTASILPSVYLMAVPFLAKLEPAGRWWSTPPEVHRAIYDRWNAPWDSPSGFRTISSYLASGQATGLFAVLMFFPLLFQWIAYTETYHIVHAKFSERGGRCCSPARMTMHLMFVTIIGMDIGLALFIALPTINFGAMHDLGTGLWMGFTLFYVGIRMWVEFNFAVLVPLLFSFFGSLGIFIAKIKSSTLMTSSEPLAHVFYASECLVLLTLIWTAPTYYLTRNYRCRSIKTCATRKTKEDFALFSAGEVLSSDEEAISEAAVKSCFANSRKNKHELESHALTISMCSDEGRESRSEGESGISKTESDTLSETGSQRSSRSSGENQSADTSDRGRKKKRGSGSSASTDIGNTSADDDGLTQDPKARSPIDDHKSPRVFSYFSGCQDTLYAKHSKDRTPKDSPEKKPKVDTWRRSSHRGY